MATNKVKEQGEVNEEVSSTDTQNAEIEFLRKQNEELQNNMKALMAQFAEMQNNTHHPQSGSKWDDINIVHLVDNIPGCTTHIELSNYTIDMASIGETRTLTVQQFEELVGKYRAWFDRGVIAVGAGSEYYAQRNGLTIATDSFMTAEFVKNLGRMPMSQVEEIYNNVCQGQKEFIVSYWKRQLILKAPEFCDIKKVQVLNGFTNNAFEYELLELARK